MSGKKFISWVGGVLLMGLITSPMYTLRTANSFRQQKAEIAAREKAADEFLKQLPLFKKAAEIKAAEEAAKHDQ